VSGFVQLSFQGRFGNQMFQYAHARGYAERNGLELRTWPWVGERIFEIAHAHEIVPNLERHTEKTSGGKPNIELRGYFQNQESLIYTRDDCRRWFTFRPEIRDALEKLPPAECETVAHRRLGDFVGYGYPVVSLKSYDDFTSRMGHYRYTLVTDDAPTQAAGFTGELDFLPDFFKLMRAAFLLRGNSSFSYWAAVLSNARVFSPVIDGKVGGREHDCDFVMGNWPRLANLAFVSDLFLPEK
jgi:hypothetical protein